MGFVSGRAIEYDEEFRYLQWIRLLMLFHSRAVVQLRWKQGGFVPLLRLALLVSSEPSSGFSAVEKKRFCAAGSGRVTCFSEPSACFSAARNRFFLAS